MQLRHFLAQVSEWPRAPQSDDIQGMGKSDNDKNTLGVFEGKAMEEDTEREVQRAEDKNLP